MPRAVAVDAPVGLLLFASAQDEPRARRPTDVALVITGVVLLLLAATFSEIGGDIDVAIADALASLPGFFDPLWLVLAWTPVAWSVVLIAVSLLRGRRALARDLVAGVAASLLVAVFLAALLGDGAWDSLTRFADLDGPPAFPPGALTISAAVIATASPHLSRPFRHFGRWIVGGQFLATMVLGAALPSGSVVALTVGQIAAAIVHLIVGSPGGRPTTSRIELALRGLGIDVVELIPTVMHAHGVVSFTGSDAAGPIAVKVYGRDAWDAQLLTTAWRSAWYRGTQRTARLSRLELVEHEGFMTLLADRAGVRVPNLVTAGSAGRGDALVVVRPDGVPASAYDGDISDEAVAGLWGELQRLHGAGIVHRQLDLDRLVVRSDGSLGFGDLSSASVTESVGDARHDEAQLLGAFVLLVGEERAGSIARHTLGDDRLLAVLPYLQEAAMAPDVGDALDDADIELDDVRNRLRTLLGAEEQPLIKLRRVTAGSVLNLALLAIATYTLIAVFGDLDVQELADELRDASWWWLVLALVLAQLPRVPAAMSTMGSIAHPLPYGPLLALQFAICYVNLAIPSTAARVAINVRFFQRFGVKPTEAMAAGVIDSVSGFVVQIVLFLLLFTTSDLDFGVSLDTSDTSGLATVVLIVLAVVVVALFALLLIRPVRERVFALIRRVAVSLRVLRSPTKLLQLFGGNVLSQVLFGVALAACVRAFGTQIPLTELVLINTVVTLFAGLLPIPGGIGVSEAGLTLGLTAAGLSSETAFAIAIMYRIASFYLPPVWGWFCYRWLISRRYL